MKTIADIYVYTSRKEEVLAFVIRHLDSNGIKAFGKDLDGAIKKAVLGSDIEPVARLLMDWEATAEIESDPAFSKELHKAFSEAEPQEEV